MRIRSRATLRDFDGQEYMYIQYLCDSVKNVVIHNCTKFATVHTYQMTIQYFLLSIYKLIDLLGSYEH